jgi:murein DD-endopeptidase MepM/ murein hydrolase activator NlpD
MRTTIKKIFKIRTALAYIAIAVVFTTTNVAAQTTPPPTAPATTPAVTGDPNDPSITAQSLYGNWNQYVPGDQPLGGSCGGTGGGFTPADINVDKGFSLGTDAKERRVNLVKALMRDYQLSGEQGSGIVGNFMHESGGQHVPPDVNEGGKPGPPAFHGGYGWAQWTASRQTAFIDFAVANGYMASRTVNATDAADYSWLKNELNTGYKSTIIQIKTKGTPEDAAISFEATFEHAGVPALANRTKFARQVFGELTGNTTGGGTPTSPTGGTGAPCGGSGGGGIVGANAFPLVPNKRVVTNPGMFHNGTADRGGHPYTAFDILANQGSEVVAFMAGRVTAVSTDRCPGRYVEIHDDAQDISVAYMHMNMAGNVQVGQTVAPGQHVGVVGPPPNGCGTMHLHIDASHGSRPGCSRLNCPAANASKFIDIGPQLFTTFQALPN